MKQLQLQHVSRMTRPGRDSNGLFDTELAVSFPGRCVSCPCRIHFTSITLPLGSSTCFLSLLLPGCFGFRQQLASTLFSVATSVF